MRSLPSAPKSARVTPAAANALALLPGRIAELIFARLAEIAEVAALAPVGDDGWDESSLLQLKVYHSVALYSLDRDGGIVVHNVVPAESISRAG
jgi:hypothetical protein